LWNDKHKKADVIAACQASLRHLRLRHLDLYLIHWPVTGNSGDTVEPSIQETWQAMEKLVDMGMVKAIVQKMKEVLKYARIRPSVLQVEIHPYFRNEALVEWCAAEGIHVTAYSPLGSPDSATMLHRTAPVLMQDPAVQAITSRIGRDVGQVS
ncbi:hypothetical protein CYMTET_36242, partial [Cymbomonas tetramitiformis]